MSSFGKASSRSCVPETKKPGSKPAARSAKERPSDKLNPKTVDPFKSAAVKSGFAEVYSTGGIPCRLQHGSVKHKLSWNMDIHQVPYDPVLITLAEGLKETVHPYYFVAREGFRELLNVPNATDKTIPLLSRLAPHLKAALICKESEVFSAALTALVQLSRVVGPHLNPHLKMIIPALAKRSMDRKHKDEITDALMEIETNGGKEAYTIIKSKVPTYSSAIQ